jgi:hypothetical protein
MLTIASSLMLVAVACGGGGDRNGCAADVDFASELVVRDHEGNTDNFVRDRPLELEYSFTNCRDRTIHLFYGSTQESSFSIDRLPITNVSNVWSQRVTVFDAGIRDAVDAGETRRRSAMWSEARAADPGAYLANGLLANCRTEPGSGFECPGEASVEFTIVDD